MPATADLAEVEIFPCRELLPTDEVRARAAALIGAEPWGREQWERLAEGLVFDGMESWMPWLTPRRAHPRSTCSTPDAQVCSSSRGACATAPPRSSPRRPTSPAALGKTWGAGRHRVPAPARRPSTGCSRTPPARARGRSSRMAEGPDTAVVEATGWGPVVGDGERPRPERSRSCSASGYRVVVAADTDGSARSGCTTCCSRSASTSTVDLDERRPTSPARRPHRRRAARARLRAARRSSSRCSPRPTSPVGAAPTAGRGPAAPRRRRRSSTTSSPATTSCTTSTASAATAGWSSGPSAASSATTCCSSTRAATSSTSRPTRSTPSATTPAASRPTLHRLGGGDLAEDQGAGRAPRCARSRRSWSSSTRRARARHRATRSPPTRRGSTRWRRRSPTRRRPTS